jgi:hypothetical protein
MRRVRAAMLLADILRERLATRAREQTILLLAG